MGLATALIREAPKSAEPTRRTRKWTREEYYLMGDLGLIGPDERVELINGEIIQKLAPQKSPHFTSLTVTEDALLQAFGRGFVVRVQGPMTLDDHSEPEPDILVVRGKKRDYTDHHPGPAEALLVVEISDTTLSFDRRKKGKIYAAAGIAEYWIVDIKERRLEVYREPTPDGKYKSLTICNESDTVNPLAAPNFAVNVSDLLP